MDKKLSKFPVTISLIILNVIVFFVTGSSKSVSSQDFFSCAKRVAPSCIEQVSNEEYINCIVEFKPSDPDVCLYGIGDTCMSDKLFKQKCIPVSILIKSSLSFSTNEINKGSQIYGVLTYMFVHADLAHIVSNMISLFILGIYVEMRIGKIKYLLIYFISGFGSALAFYINFPQNSSMIGASGAIFGLLAANLVLNFLRSKSIDLNEPVPAISTPSIVVIFIIQIMYLMAAGSGVAYSGHIGGFITGFILAIILRPKNLIYYPQPIA